MSPVSQIMPNHLALVKSGLVQSGKSWKVMEFRSFNLQTWKV